MRNGRGLSPFFLVHRRLGGLSRSMGRKRHIAVDTDGRLLMVNLTPADISDSAGAQMILDGVRKRWPWLKHLFADGAYDRPAQANNSRIGVFKRTLTYLGCRGGRRRRCS